LVVNTDSSHLSEALFEILTNHKKQQIFRENCKTLIGKFDISNSVSMLEKVYEEIAN